MAPASPRQGSDLHALLEEASNLPLGNPETFLRVATLCRDPRADARAIASEIQRDDGFAAAVLRLANSAYFASSSRIGDLPMAVARLGLGTVESLAISIPGARLTGDNRDGLGGARRELHRHAIRAGLAARMIAPAGADHEQALAAGLVHNIGLSAIALLRPEIFRRLLDVASAGAQLCEAEEDLLGFTHAELGGLLVEGWRFPLPLVLAVVDHENPPAGSLAGTVRVADLLAREAGAGVEATHELTDDVCDRAGIDLAWARERVAPLFDAYDRLEGSVDAPPPSGETRVVAALDAMV